MLDHRHYEADAIDVLGLGPGAKLGTGFANADVDVGAHRAFLHIAVARADVAENRPELPEVSACFCWRTHVGPRYDLHQCDARPVEVDVAHRRVLVVHQLARVLLDVDALNADALGARLVLVVEQHFDLTLADERVVELADLVALRQVGVEVIFPVEARPFVDLRAERQARANRLTDALAVGDREHAGHRGVDQADLCVGLRTESGGRAREELGVGNDLGVDLEADHDLPLAGFALDAEWCCCVSHTYHHFSGRAVKPARSSIARPAFSTVCSSSSLPMRCRPSGSPCPSNPPGTLIAGSPARLAGTAKTSFRYIASGSVVSPIPNAADGAVGVRITSHCSNAFAKSCLISVRTFCALVKYAS